MTYIHSINYMHHTSCGGNETGPFFTAGSGSIHNYSNRTVTVLMGNVGLVPKIKNTIQLPMPLSVYLK